MTKQERHIAIKEIISTKGIESQDMLLNLLLQRGFNLTQATLSRDIKELQIVKVPMTEGHYIYQLTKENAKSIIESSYTKLSTYGYLGIEFSGNLAVVKTRPGYAMGIAAEIDERISNEIIGTVAGDDTILLVIRESITRDEVVDALSKIINII